MATMPPFGVLSRSTRSMDGGDEAMNDQSDLHAIRLLLGQMQIEIALLKRRVKDLEPDRLSIITS